MDQQSPRPHSAAAGLMQPVVERVQRAIMDNHLSADPDGETPIDATEALRVAAEVVQELAPAGEERFPRLLYRKGLMFVVEDGVFRGEDQADLLHVGVWYGTRWIIVESIPLPPADAGPEAASQHPS